VLDTKRYVNIADYVKTGRAVKLERTILLVGAHTGGGKGH
jgi:hypothetical protein